MIAANKLGKYGKILDTTPSEVREEFGNGTAAEFKKEPGTTSVETLAAATPQATSVSSRKVSQTESDGQVDLVCHELSAQPLINSKLFFGFALYDHSFPFVSVLHPPPVTAVRMGSQRSRSQR